MLNTITLNNIKSFKEETKINLANITLLYGNNSVGKSTIWKFLMMLQQTYREKQKQNFVIQSSLNLTDPTFFADRKTLSFDQKKEIYFTIEDYYGVALKIICKNNSVISSPYIETPNFDLIKERSQTFQNMENEIKDINQSNLKSEIKEDKIRKINEKFIFELSKGSILKTQLLGRNLRTELPESQFKSFQILKYGRLFCEYEIIPIDNHISKLNKKKSSEFRPFFYRTMHAIGSILQKRFGGDTEVPIKFTSPVRIKSLRTSKINPKISTIIYDYADKNGPLEFKRETMNANYLLIPSFVSEDFYFWKDLFELKNLALKLIKNEDLANVDFEDWETKYLVNKCNIAENQIKNILDLRGNFRAEIEKIILSKNLREFCKVMAESYKYSCLISKSLIEISSLREPHIYSCIVDFVEGVFDHVNSDLNPDRAFIAHPNESIQYKVSLRKIKKNDTEVDNYISKFFATFCNYSFIQNYKSFIENLEIIKIDEKLSEKNLANRFKDSLLRKEVCEKLNKINLPFTFITKYSEVGTYSLSVSNKRIPSENNKNLSLDESGSGLSTLLPILTTIYGQQNKTFILEEPEKHLHPSVQGNLIELLHTYSRSNNLRFIIETHSEHFILRLQKLLRQKKLNSMEIAINYIFLDEKGEGSKVDFMEIDNNGEFKNSWRHGFFTERLSELKS